MPPASALHYSQTVTYPEGEPYDFGLMTTGDGHPEEFDRLLAILPPRTQNVKRLVAALDRFAL
jgi:hypothetical protein